MHVTAYGNWNVELPTDTSFKIWQYRICQDLAISDLLTSEKVVTKGDKIWSFPKVPNKKKEPVRILIVQGKEMDSEKIIKWEAP